MEGSRRTSHAERGVKPTPCRGDGQDTARAGPEVWHDFDPFFTQGTERHRLGTPCRWQRAEGSSPSRASGASAPIHDYLPTARAGSGRAMPVQLVAGWETVLIARPTGCARLLQKTLTTACVLVGPPPPRVHPPRAGQYLSDRRADDAGMHGSEWRGHRQPPPGLKGSMRRVRKRARSTRGRPAAASRCWRKPL